MSSLNKIIPISAEELATTSIRNDASSFKYQGLTIATVLSTLVGISAGGILLGGTLGLFFLGVLASQFLRLVSLNNAGEQGDLEGVIRRLKKKERVQVLNFAKEQLVGHNEPLATMPSPIITLPADHIADASTMVAAPAPQQEEAIAPPPIQPPVDANPFTPADLVAQEDPVSEPQEEENPFQFDAPALDDHLDFCEIPSEDLASLIGNCPQDEANYLFVGKSRSGKTTFLLNAMAARLNARKDTGFVILNGKPERENDWGGLRNGKGYLAVNTEERAAIALKRVVVFQKKLAEWQDGGDPHNPLFIVADEVNNQMALLSEKESAIYAKYLGLIATQCMSEGCGLWISTHSPLVSDIRLNRQQQNSFQIVALGREGKYESIEACLSDPYIVRDEALRSNLREQLRSYKNSGSRDAIAFTTQGGNPRLVRLPHYSKDLRLVDNSVPQPAAPAPQPEPPADNAPEFSSEDQELIAKMKAIKAEQPDWGKVAILRAATGKSPGGDRLWNRAKDLYNYA